MNNTISYAGEDGNLANSALQVASGPKGNGCFRVGERFLDTSSRLNVTVLEINNEYARIGFSSFHNKNGEYFDDLYKNGKEVNDGGDGDIINDDDHANIRNDDDDCDDGDDDDDDGDDDDDDDDDDDADTVSDPPPCGVVTESNNKKCFSAVTWAMKHGIRINRSDPNYANLTESSTFEDFQNQFFRLDHLEG
eukprot:Pgem_evm1s11487